MIARELPPDEWPRLEGTPLGPVYRGLPSTAAVVVVEDTGGAIVGHWALLPLYHAEGVWVDPAHQAKGVVARRLWVGFRELAHARGITAVVTASTDPMITRLLDRLHAVPMPGQPYVLTLEDPPTVADRVRGRHFHESLHQLVPGIDHHADDPAHDAAVGQALRIGLEDGEPERGIAHYNQWALTHGYAPIRVLARQVDGSVVLDLVTAHVAVSPTGELTCQPPPS